jgi:hypothetical protein
MGSGPRRHLSFANVMSVIAVFIALGGAAYAATKLPKNSVGTKQIKRNAVNSSKVKDGSLQSSDFAAGVLQSGKQGEKGAPGEPGKPGEPATKLFAFVRTGYCCETGHPQLDPPKLYNAHGVVSASIPTGEPSGSTGLYDVTFDTSLLPKGNVENCVPFVSLGSNDAATPNAGQVSFGHPNGVPADTIRVFFRNIKGELAELNNFGGSPGFSIALFC